MLLPKLPDKKAYFSNFYNLTLLAGGSKAPVTKENVYIYSWNESIHPKRSNEIASALYHKPNNSDLVQSVCR